FSVLRCCWRVTASTIISVNFLLPSQTFPLLDSVIPSFLQQSNTAQKVCSSVLAPTFLFWQDLSSYTAYFPPLSSPSSKQSSCNGVAYNVVGTANMAFSQPTGHHCYWHCRRAF